MRFEVFMINELGDFHEETVIANNENEAKRNVQTYNHKSKVLEAKWGYKQDRTIKKMEELTYKDLSETELDALKDIYISSRVNSMTESDLRKFVKEIIIDQIKGTVGNAEEKEAWEEIKDHFSEDLSQKILEVKEKCNKNPKVEQKSPEEIEFDRRLGLLKQQQEEQSSKDMWQKNSHNTTQEKSLKINLIKFYYKEKQIS